MESNNEFLILSLLNLYTSYVNLKKKGPSNTDKKPLYNHYAKTQLQSFSTFNKDRQLNNKNAVPTRVATNIQKEKTGDRNDLVTHDARNTNPITIDAKTAVAIDNEKEKSIDNDNALGNVPIDGSPTNLISITDSAADKDKPKIIKRRRRRGKKTEDDTEQNIKRKRIRRWHVRPINRDRAITGYHRKVFANIKKMDQQQFFLHTRMSKSLFDWLLTFVQTSIRKSRQSIFAEERLAITLNYLAYGPSLQSIAWKYKIGKSTARQIVLDTCGALWNLLSPIYLSEPTTAQYADNAEDFKNKWDIPNCVGAIDGKLISIRDPTKTAPINNKVSLSIPILGICDAKFKFSAVSVGNFNNHSDDGIFQLSPQNNIIISDNLPLPSCKSIFPSHPPLPHFFISDTSFPLRKNIMRPYAEENLDAKQTIFNYKISRAQTVSENTFGILTSRFRVLLTIIEFLPENCKIIILACIVLHNFIMTNDEEQLYCPSNFVDRQTETGIIEEGEWRKELKDSGDQPLPSMTSSDSRSTFEANNLRNTLANIFASEAISYEIQIV